MQPGRRVLLDWFYKGPSLGLVHLYPSLERAFPRTCTCSHLKRMEIRGVRRKNSLENLSFKVGIEGQYLIL